MQSFLKSFGAVAIVFSTNLLQAQIVPGDSLVNKNKIHLQKIEWSNSSLPKKFPAKSFIIPGFMIAYGFTTLKSDGLADINEGIKEEWWTESPHKKRHIDNYLQFSPAIAVYALNAAGIKGKNNFKDRSMIYLMSNVFLNTTVFSLKNLTHQQRPDGSSYTSFPSGHTAEAFASAEFLRQEFRDVSPWYGVAGYAAATATGLLRMYNNKHWLSDVVTGAGIGIASTKLAYWLYPKIKKTISRKKEINTMVMPFYQDHGGGLSFVYNFH